MASQMQRSEEKGRRLPRAETQAQKLMIFLLSAALFGLANILTEVLPTWQVGPVEFEISYLLFVPLTMVALFNPLWAAIGAPVGEVVFKDLLMGDFGGLGEIEGIIQMALALFVAGLLIRDPRNRTQIAIAGLAAVVIDKGLSAIVDIGKVWAGVEDFEAVEGLPESILVIEGVSFLMEIVMSGILFGIIPALWLIPRLYGKIEPLMGLAPRTPETARAGWATPAFIMGAIAFAALSLIVEFIATSGFEVGLFEPDYRGQYGDTFLWVGVAAAVAVIAGVFAWSRRRRPGQSAR
jgi:hypothetical protein